MHNSPETRISRERAEAGSGEKPAVLVIDDNPANIRLLEVILETEGYAPLSALNGRQGREMAKRRRPAVILLDVMMPGESGFDACHLLKSDPVTADIPVIFVTAVDDVGSKIKGLTLGAVDYITKPFDRREVVARVQRHLETRDTYRNVIEAQAKRLKQVREAQQAILVRPEDLPEAKFAVRYVPILEAGGDFYDVFAADRDVFGFFVADISGHDIKASYNTFALTALIHQNTGNGTAPGETLQIINQVFTRLLQDGEYLTACYARLDRGANRLTLVNAGHLPAVYIDVRGDIRVLEAKGDILGAFESVSFEPLSLAVPPGGRMFFYTDGLIERYGTARRRREDGLVDLIEACVETHDLPLGSAVGEIVTALCPDGRTLQDDVLLLGVDL
ncbi:MAG: SpoIIE family protein phosphatase [Syntrophales bacterium]